MRKKLLLPVIIILIFTLAIACGKKEAVPQKIGNVEFETIEPDVLKDEALQQWYEESYKTKYTHSVSYVDGYKYMLICAGEMPEEGYGIKITDAKKEDDFIYLSAKLLSPGQDEEVKQQGLYPHLLLRFTEEAELCLLASLDMTEARDQGENNSDCYGGLIGMYIGQADNNFIEIELAPGVDFPGNDEPVVFKLSEDVKEHFQGTGEAQILINENDTVMFDCVKTQQGQWEITEIKSVTL